MKKILVSMFLLVFGLCLVGCEQPHTDPKDEFYLHGTYTGECIYSNPVSSSIPSGIKYEFVNNKYNNIEYIKLKSISGFFDNVFDSYNGNSLKKLETDCDIYYYEIASKNDKHFGIYIFKSDNELFLFAAYYIIDVDTKVYTVTAGYKLTKQDYITLPTETFEVEESIYDNVCKEYNIEYKQLYYVIDNYGTYLQLYPLISRKEIEPLDKEGGEQMFKDKVIICYPRAVSYSINFIPVEYSYDENKNEIICINTYKPSDDVEFPCVVLAYCFDFVEVPKDIYNKLNK